MIVCGLDISKDTIECKIDGMSDVRSFSNSITGYKRLVNLFGKADIGLVVLESTGGYERGVYRYLWASQIPTSIVNPRQTRAFAYSLGRRAKNDHLDAEILMEYGKKVQPVPTEPISEAVTELRELLSRRHQLNRMLVAEKNHAKAPNTSLATRRSIRAVTKVIQQQIKQIGLQMEEIINSNNELSAKSDKLSALTGVGPVLLCTLLADMPELGTLERNQASALAGVAPYDKDSGNFHGKRAIAGGRVRVRCALYMATLTAIRHNPVLKQFYQRLVTRY